MTRNKSRAYPELDEEALDPGQVDNDIGQDSLEGRANSYDSSTVLSAYIRYGERRHLHEDEKDETEDLGIARKLVSISSIECLNVSKDWQMGYTPVCSPGKEHE